MKLLNAPMNNYTITSRFGPRDTGIIGASRDHKGIDMVSKEKDLILVADGILVSAFWNDFRGWACEFDIGERYTVLYQHMAASCQLEAGKEYPAGTVIGKMGSSRSKEAIPSMGAHLHFELRYNRQPVDPARWLSDVEARKMIKEQKVICNEEEKLIRCIEIDGENYGRLRDLQDRLAIAEVDYNQAKGVPVIRTK